VAEGAGDVAGQATEQAGDAAQGTQDAVGQGADQIGQTEDQAEEAVDEAAEGAGGGEEQATEENGQDARSSKEATDFAADETESTNGEHGNTRRTVDELGDIIETTLNEDGEVVGEELVGNLDSLPAEEEYVDEEGRVVSRVRDESGSAFERLSDDKGNMVGARAV
jgi:uncharacterized protein YuzE